MRRLVLLSTVAVATVVLVSRAESVSSTPYAPAIVPPGQPLVTAIVDPVNFGGPEAQAAFANTRQAGARFARLILDWAVVAPPGSSRPTGFQPRRPTDPLYRWEGFDAQVRGAFAAGLQSIVTIMGAPEWARNGRTERVGDGPVRPSPGAFADFATALGKRYGGGVDGLPRVRYWLIWNEPNFNQFLMPQFEAGRPASPDWYRLLVNAAADALHAAHPDNVVIAGGLTPFGQRNGWVDQVAPMVFMRKLLCLSDGASPKRTCRRQVRFDVWGHNPYTTGGPTHRAPARDDVSLPDLWKMKRVLDAAVRAGTLESRRPPGFWVTEFSWDTKPPDPNGVPERLHARWVAEALYRMWNQHVTLVTWFQIRDNLKSFAQSGLYFSGSDGIASDDPKLALKAFRFPFVAFRKPKGQIDFWGRSPGSRSAVVVEQKIADGWRFVRIVRPNRYGIFAGRFASTARSGYLRARTVDGREAALPFSLVVPPDRRVCSFGTC